MMYIKKRTNKPVFQSHKQSDMASDQTKPSGAFQRLKAKIKNTDAYQIFFVRAQQSRFSRGLILLFFVCSFVGHYGLIGMLNPPSKFEELKVTRGYLDGYYTGRGGTITIRNAKGGIEKFDILITNDYAREQRIRSLTGELITIYYSTTIDPLLYFRNYAEAIVYKNTYITNYSLAKYCRIQEWHKMSRLVFVLCAVFGFTSLFIVYLRHRAD